MLGQLAIYVIEVVCILVSVVVHEVSHGLAANALGDDTAKRAGRLSFNPAKHLDPFGSVLLPLIMIVLGGPVFAYAKPVPYNPYRLKNRKFGELGVALAGPFSNLLLALFGALMCHVVHSVYGDFSGVAREVLYWTYVFGRYFCLINLILLFFNVIPLPPLDGATVVSVFLNERGMEVFYKVKQYSMFILLLLLFVVPYIFGFDPLSWYFRNTAYALYGLLV